MIRITENDTIEVVFMDGENEARAVLSLKTITRLLMDESYEIITDPKCEESSCAVNGFCECDPINEDMEFAAIYLNNKPTLTKCDNCNEMVEPIILGEMCPNCACDL